MTDAEDCARYLCELASKPDTSDLRKQIEGAIDDYLFKEPSRSNLRPHSQTVRFRTES
jgi:hypothetical protein